MAPSDSFISALLGGISTNSKSITDDPALDAFSRTAAENSLYNQLAVPILSTKFNTNTWSPMENLGVSLGQSFLGGLFSNLGRKDVAKQYETAASILPDLYRNPSAVAVPEGVDSEAFGALKLAALREKAKKERDLQDSVIAHVFTSNPSFAAIAPDTASRVGLTELGSALASNPSLLQDDKKKGIEIPAEMQGKLASSAAIISEARDISKRLQGTSWQDLQLAKNFPGLDSSGIGQSITNLVDKLGKARSGASLNKEEQKLYTKLISGDMSATPQQVSLLLNKLADSEAKDAVTKLEFSKNLQKGDIEGIKQQFSYTPEPTIPNPTKKETGRIEIVNGKKVRVVPD